jgi:histidinol-phosphatase (PHP family)
MNSITNTDPILYDTHMHTPLCKHATGEPEAYAAAAEQRGLAGIIFTCHNPDPSGWAPKVRMAMDQFEQYLALIQRARAAWQDRVDVRLGLESDYYPGVEPWLEELHARAEFHHILGSVHALQADYKALYWHNDPLDYQRTYFEHLAMAAETGLFDTLAHPDLVKIMFPSQWDPELVLDDIRRSLDRIARTGLAMELNTSGLNKAYAEMNPGRLMLTEMRERNIPVVVGSDAHEPKRVAADFEQAFDLLEEVGYSQLSFFLERQRQEVAIDQARQSLVP